MNATATGERAPGDVRAILVIVLAAAVLFLSAPRAGQFWWSDAPRHALNGAFVLDLMRDLPLQDPRGWAVDYYFQYPALTILFYPPLLPALEAISFLAFGVSPWSAQLAVSLMLAIAGLGAYALLRRWFDPMLAAAGAVTFMGLPEIALWGRQVMLELPAFAFLLWAAWAFLRLLDGGGPRWLYATAALYLAALYGKQSVIFLAPVMAAMLLWQRGLRPVLRDRHVWGALLLSAVGVAPLVAMTVRFGAANLQSVAGVDDAVAGRWSLANWSFYPGMLPDQAGWIVVLLATAGAVGAVLLPSWRLRRGALLAGWLAVGYVFFSLISLKEQRLDLFLLFPVAALAILALERLGGRMARPAAVLLASGTLLFTAVARPVPFIEGYARAASYIADVAEPDARILFSGMRDGSFIFNLRSHEERDDLTVVRADKLLLDVAVRRGLGLEQRAVQQEEFRDRIDDLGIGWVVVDPDFWSDLENMQMLQRILESDGFALQHVLPVRSNVSYAEREIRIYRNLSELPDDPSAYTLRLGMIDTTLAPGR